jgi:hypothetical protein
LDRPLTHVAARNLEPTLPPSVEVRLSPKRL